MDISVPESYLRWEVEVHYLTDNGAYTDKGTLSAVSAGWLELRKPTKKGQEIMLIPTSAVRLMKAMTPPDDDTLALLRPVNNDPATLIAPKS